MGLLSSLRFIVPAACCGFLSSSASAWDSDLRGNVALEARGFWEPHQYPGQRDTDEALVLAPELHLEDAQGRAEVVFSPFFRLDSGDPERTHADLRELSWRYSAERWELRLGVQHVFWGVAESNHLVDIINQTDLVENPDGEDKLGQPMANLAIIRPWGTLDFMVLPWFRERSFPGRHGRLRSPSPVAVGSARYEADEKAQHVDFAIRYSVSLNQLDIGLYQFRGTNRDATLITSRDGAGRLHLTPYYELIDQTGVDAQYAWGAWLFKFEGLYRSGEHPGPYAASVAGFEYTFSGAFGTVMDLGLLAEINFDTRGERASTPFNHDVFAGLRIAANDAENTQLLAGVLVDVIQQERLLNLELQRRLDMHWKLGLELRAFHSRQMATPLGWLDTDDYLGAELSRFF